MSTFTSIERALSAGGIEFIASGTDGEGVRLKPNNHSDRR
jgi:hypothetical protein